LHLVKFLWGCLALLSALTIPSFAETPEEVLLLLQDRHILVDIHERLERAPLPDLVNALGRSDPWAELIPQTGSEPVTQHAKFGVKLVAIDGKLVLLPLFRQFANLPGINGPQELLDVDGFDMQDVELSIATTRLQVPPESILELGVKSLEDGIERDLLLEPHSLQFQSVLLRKISGLPVLQIAEFTRTDTSNRVKNALTLIDPDIGVVIDIRYAGGGDLAEAADTADLFLPVNHDIAIRVNSKGRAFTYTSRNEPLISADIPILLLVSSATASAAEVFASALSERENVTIMGRPSFGKCFAQSQFELQNGSSLKFSTHRLYGPKFTPCSTAGIRPDLLVSEELTHITPELVRRFKMQSDKNSNKPE